MVEKNDVEQTLTYNYTVEDRLQAVILLIMVNSKNEKVRKVGIALLIVLVIAGSITIIAINREKKENSYSNGENKNSYREINEDMIFIPLGISNKDRNKYELTQYINDVTTQNTQVLMEYSNESGITAYSYGNERLTYETNGATYQYNYDGRGSVTNLIVNNYSSVNEKEKKQKDERTYEEKELDRILKVKQGPVLNTQNTNQKGAATNPKAEQSKLYEYQIKELRKLNTKKANEIADKLQEEMKKLCESSNRIKEQSTKAISQNSENSEKYSEESVIKNENVMYAKEQPVKLPIEGEPNSYEDLLNPDGTIKQRRYYGEDGKAKVDIDYNHREEKDVEFPHQHDWDWNKQTPKQPAKPVEDKYKINKNYKQGINNNQKFEYHYDPKLNHELNSKILIFPMISTPVIPEFMPGFVPGFVPGFAL